MKKLLLFLLFFGSGLLVLHWLSGRGPEAPPEETPPESTGSTGPAGPTGPVEPPPPEREPAGEDWDAAPEPPERDGLHIAWGGTFQHKYYDTETGRAILRLSTEKSRTRGALDEFEQVRAEVLDAQSSEPQAHLEAATGTVRRQEPAEGVALPDWERLLELGTVTVDVLHGLPLAPLTFRAPHATVDLTDPARRRIRTPDPVEVESDRLELSGTGLVADLDEGTLLLERDARLAFRPGDSSDPGGPGDPGLGAVERGVLSSAGPMSVRSVDVPLGRELSVDAEGAALLALGEEGRLEADQIALRGREDPASPDGLVPTSVVAEGSVVWTSGANVFRSERARVEFDAQGEPTSVTLEGLPTFVLALEAEDVELPGVEREDVSRLAGSGQGPLRIVLDPAGAGEPGAERAFTFDLEGPATIETPAGTLRSGGSVRAWSRPAEQARGFFATGGVVLEDDQATLETAELDVEVRGSGEEAVLSAEASRGARLVGRLEDGTDFSLSSPDRLEVESSGRRWRVEEGTGVVLTIEGPEGFTARADRVRSFDPEARTLRADGNVSFESSRGEARGEHLDVRDGEERFTLEGTPEAPARIDGPEGRLAAARFVREGERLTASGGVEGTVLGTETDGGLSELSCEWLEVIRREEELEDGGERRAWELAARGGVEASWVEDGEATSLEGRSLRGDGFERRSADGATLETRSHLIVEEEVWSSLRLERGWIDVHSDRLELWASERPRSVVDVVDEGDEEDGLVRRGGADATGSVSFEVQTDASQLSEDPAADEGAWISLEGSGERLVLDEEGEGLLLPAAGKRVSVDGGLPTSGMPFELTASLLRFTAGERLEAERPHLIVRRPGETPERPEGAEGDGEEPEGVLGPAPLEAWAEHMIATQEVLELIGGVTLGSSTASGVPWRLTTERVRFEGRAVAGTPAALRAMEASGGVDFVVGARGAGLDEQVVARASGETLEANTAVGTLRLSGAPARIASPAFVSEGDWIEFDPDLQIVTRTGRGRMHPAVPAPEEPPALRPEPAQPPERREVQGAPAQDQPRWSLEYLSSNTMIEPDLLVYVLQEPRFYDSVTEGTLRASWAVFWLDRRQWEDLPGRLASGELTPESLGLADGLIDQGRESAPAPLFGMFETTAFAGLLRESYFEGPVEILRGDDLLARADAIFLDAVDGHGWLANATVNVYGDFVDEDFKKLIVRAEWLRHSKDGSLRASSATVTPCDYEEPHVRIVTEDLLIDPILQGGRRRIEGYVVSLRGNRLEFYDRVKIPLGSLTFRTDEEGRPDLGSFDFGDSARFGTFVKARIVRPAGKLGETVNDVLRGNPFEYDAHYSIDASYLGSRGILLDLGLSVESANDYWLDFMLGGLPDSGEDKGYIRVPEDERDRLRLWYRGRSRHVLGEDHWIDLALSHQTDPGVQSEFFESDFERWEQNETFAHWRLARDGSYYDASVKVRTEDFRTDVNELPSLGVYRGLRPLLSVGPLRILHLQEARAEFLQRLEGEEGLQSPFLLPARFPDGEGERDVLRFDGRQRLEAPIPLGLAGLRLTPFAAARFTAWDEGIDRDESPVRFLVELGARLATTLWRRAAGGTLHQVSPYVQVSDDVAYHESGDVLRFDSVDDAPGATLVDVGTRARFRIAPGRDPLLDLDVRVRHAEGVRERPGLPLPADRGDGWSAATFAELNVEPFDVPFQLTHDARYDLNEEDVGDTIYTATRAALRLTEDLRFEAGHRRGLLSQQSIDLDPFGPGDPRFQRAFEAASVSAIWSWTDKWEFETRQVISLRDDTRLNNDLVLRRFGHDIIFEIEFSVREGEGTSLGFHVRPRFGWRDSRLGYLGS